MLLYVKQIPLIPPIQNKINPTPHLLLFFFGNSRTSSVHVIKTVARNDMFEANVYIFCLFSTYK